MSSLRCRVRAVCLPPRSAPGVYGVARNALLASIAIILDPSTFAVAQETAPTEAVPLPTLSVETGSKKKTKAAKKGSTLASNTAAVTEAEETPSVRDTSADTEGSNSYTSKAVTVGGKEPLSRREVPQSVSVITRKQIEDQNANALQDALSYVPGVTVVPFDPSQQEFHSRGYEVNVAYDGIPAHSGARLHHFDLAIYDRVEVLRGPDGLFQGSGNPSGVVNLVKKRPRDEAGAAWSVSYGSWNNKWAELDLTTPLNESKTLRGRAVLAGRDKDFFYDRFDEEKWVGYGVVEYDISRNTLLTISAAQQKYDGPSWMGLPAYTNGDFLNVPRSTNVYPDWNSMKWDTREYTASIEHKFANDWLLKASVSHRDQTFHFNDAYPWTAVDPATLTAEYLWRDAHYDYHRNAADIYLNAPILAFGLKHNLLIGYNYDRFESRNVRSGAQDVLGGDGLPLNVPILDPNSALPRPNLPLLAGGATVTEQSGFYGQARIKLLEPLTVIGGVRISDFNNESNSKSRSTASDPWIQTAWSQGGKAENEITPYGAVILDLTRELSVYGSYADIFIPQTALTYPSGTLPPRVGAQKEVGIKGEFFNKTLNASLAYFDIRDTNRAFPDPHNPGFNIPLGEVQSTGIEAEVSGRLLPGLEINAGYTYLKTEYLKDTYNQGLAINSWYPEHSFKLWAKYDFQDPAWERWSIGAGVLAQSETENAITDAQRVQPAYAVVNTLIGYELEENLHASLAINNVFDKEYYARLGGRNTYNTFGEPRNFMLTLRKSFE